MSIEIQQPFTLSPSGTIDTITDPNLQTEQHIKSLTATGPGERVMLPTYGVPLRDAVFAPDDLVVAAQLSNQISNAMATWEPSVTVNDVSVVDQPGDPSGSAAIQLDWSLTNQQSPTSSGVQTATILIGGQVVGTGLAAA